MRSHGHAGKPTYRSWESMLARCTNDKATGFERYGGKGIKVCDRWIRFENFLEDMGVRPKGTTLDRRDSSGNYDKENCRWATPAEQGENRSNSPIITIDGVSRRLLDWSVISGIRHHAIRWRLKMGWSEKDAVFMKPMRLKKKYQQAI